MSEPSSPSPPSRTPPPRPANSMSLLTGLLTETLDPGYAQSAARRAAAGEKPPAKGTWIRREQSLAVVLGIAAMALVLVVAAIQTQRSAPQVAKERQDLISQIQSGQVAENTAEKSIAALRAQLQKIQAAALGPSTEQGQQFLALSISTGAVPVTGPGVQVVVDDAPGSQAPGGGPRQQSGSTNLGLVQDIDLQHVVNGLWAAGAEAISINGQRLTSLSAIRTAGSAILVDYRPLTPPYTILAVGDTRTLAANFSETADGRYMYTLKSQLGIRFDITDESSMSLPAATQLTLTKAVPVP